MKYQETISPALTRDSNVVLEANCVDNAVLISIDNELECGRRGQWEMNSVECSCTEGYYLFNDSFCEGRQLSNNFYSSYVYTKYIYMYWHKRDQKILNFVNIFMN